MPYFQWRKNGLNRGHVIILLCCMNPSKCSLCCKLGCKCCFLFIVYLLCLKVLQHRVLSVTDFIYLFILTSSTAFSRARSDSRRALISACASPSSFSLSALVLEAGELDSDGIGAVEEVDEVLHLERGLELLALLLLEALAVAV
ncbi:Os12g0640951, partial [Oryza sativa Japonica Group]